MKITTRVADLALENNLISNGVSPLLANILSKRNIKSIDEMDMSISKLLPPWDLLNINKASSLLGNAIVEKKFILIVADFDADGATGCAVAILGLRKFNASVDFIVPDRFIFGYGLTPELIDFAVNKFSKSHKKIPDLLVTVDNGISSFQGVERAKQLGIDVLITDHHLPGKTLPDTLIVNPQQEGCKFKSKNIAGVGVIFYLLIATRYWLRDKNYFLDVEPRLDDLLSLVALGTIADLVPLDFNNRILVSLGLKRFAKKLIPTGLAALIKISNLQYEKIICSDLGFKIAPKLNAAGRLSDMSIGIKCLIEEDTHKAFNLACKLEDLNKRRKKIEATTREEGIELFKQNEIKKEGLGTILFKKNWHQGIVGLVASKVKDMTTSPTIAFAYQNQESKLLKGSGRSISGVHLRDVLERISMRKPGLILAFGGHAMAAGMTIYEENLADFETAFNKALDEFSDKSLFSPIIQTDGELDLMKIDIESVHELNNAIWGQSFSPPIFYGQFQIHQKRILKGNHIKLLMSQMNKYSKKFEAIWFDADQFNSDKISVAYELNINKWQGEENIQINIKHLIK